MRHAIIYTVFDSAEKYFVHQIEEHSPEEPIGVIIDPYYYLRNQNLMLFDNDCYGMALVFNLGNDYLQDEILKKSNRYVKIGNYFLPVYILFVDDAFLSLYFDGKLYKGLAGDTTIREYKLPDPPIDVQHFILINITKKTFVHGYD